ncbi:hypothetical protein [Bdellovibrio sp. HCB337]|uniref:hypothetical protein n=1 Tax=Bdellovibrio sp. HCB337 TaxID=3394358 RepID=UPI0039A52FD4
MKTLSSLVILVLPLIMASVAGAWSSSVKNPQGALWHLQETGREQEAQALEAELRETLMRAPIQDFSILGGGVSKSWLAYFENNVVAVLKAEDPDVKDGALREVGAYVFDRALGLNMVPLTVERMIGGKKYTLQLYYPQQSDSQKNKRSEFHSPRLSDMGLFDYVIYNLDRDITTSHNVLIGSDGRLVAIDHGRVFFLESEYDLSLQEEELRGASKDFKQKLKSLNLSQVRQTLGPYMSSEVLQELMKRIQMVQKRLESLPGQELPKDEFPKQKIPKSFTFPLSLKSREIYSLKSFPNILKGSGDPLGFLGGLLSDQFNEQSPEFQRLQQEWSEYPDHEKISFLRLILQMDEKMNKQKYVPVVIQRLMERHVNDLPFVAKALSSQKMEDGYKKFLEYFRWGRALAPETNDYIQRFLAHPRCEAVLLY